MKLKHIIPVVLISAIIFSGCGNSDNLETTTTEITTTETTTKTAILKTIEKPIETTTIQTTVEATTIETVLEKNTAKKEPFNVEVEAKIIENNGMPNFIINTNLPDETELMLTLNDKFNDYTGQTNIIIKNGTATSEEFSSNGNPLSGEYTLTVSMSIPTLQTDNVRAVIGENGEYITGKYVTNDEITNSNWVSAEFEFTI